MATSFVGATFNVVDDSKTGYDRSFVGVESSTYNPESSTILKYEDGFWGLYITNIRTTSYYKTPDENPFTSLNWILNDNSNETTNCEITFEDF